ncbi:MAG: leucyl aminopeptidase family protein [Planctomycetota bacterium]
MFQSITVASPSARTPKRNDAEVVGLFKGASLDKTYKAYDADGTLAAAVKRAEATGEVGSIVEAFPEGASMPKRWIVVGLGDKASFTPGKMRNVAAALGKRLAAIKASHVGVDFLGPIGTVKADVNACAEAFGEGLGLLSWSRAEFKGSNTDAPEQTKLTIYHGDKTWGDGMSFGMSLAESANFARTISETPPNICTPAFVAREAQKMARKVGLSCTVIKGKALEDKQLTGIHTVGQASENAPCLVRLEYKPTRVKRGAKAAVLVGKTITYDSGGLSIKTGGFMRGMKRDMDGGCAVLGAMHAIATVIKPRRPVVALLCCAENAISDEAYRPDDILTFRNGVTVEVTNTDAEGRLVLADGLCWACQEEKPDYIIDLATLTGGVVVALGNTYAGMWCDDDELRGKIEEASERSGERVWRLPHHQEYNDLMKSDVADILNSAPVRAAHPIQGAAFLSYFVDEDVPWCHLDIAGVHAVEGERGPFIKNSATGFGVRLLADLLDME